MKKLASILICLAVILSLCACSKSGDVSNAKTHEVKSEIYTQAEIEDAINVIKKEFKNWEGCTLLEIYYAGDERSEAETQYYLKGEEPCYDADEMIVLTSSFKTDSQGGLDSLNANDIYTDWSWLLVRKDGGSWQHVDHGYA